MTRDVRPRSPQHPAEAWGFRFGRGGVHTARTMMLPELSALLEAVPDPAAPPEAYRAAVVAENRLGKRSLRTRKLTAMHLAQLYGLDPGILIFRALRDLWTRDPDARPLLALLCAYARDPVLRSATPFLLGAEEGSVVTAGALAAYLDDLEPGRFSKVTLVSTAQHLNATWTQSGHLRGRAKKVRARARATPAAAAYALLLAHLLGARGELLFHAEPLRLLDTGPDRALDLAQAAARRGWLRLKQIGSVIEVDFPRYPELRGQGGGR